MGVRRNVYRVGQSFNFRFGTNKVADNKGNAAKNRNVFILIYFQRASMLCWINRKNVTISFIVKN